jgi:hypothetical protein
MSLQVAVWGKQIKRQCHEIFCFRFFFRGKLIHKKTRSRKSRGTVPLTLHCAGASPVQRLCAHEAPSERARGQQQDHHGTFSFLFI